jgi:protein involved in polysaccharide export with SLBB domain
MKKLINVFILVAAFFVCRGNVFGQQLDDYLLGEEQHLQIVVYIIGEVSKPGEYRVSDNTDLVELISIASGTTEFSNIGSVSITRQKSAYLAASEANSSAGSADVDKEIIHFNVGRYLKSKTGPQPPRLQAGDVVYVPTNKWKTWRTVAAVLRDLSIVASTYFLYLRATD